MAFTKEQQEAIDSVRASFAAHGMTAEPEEKKPFRMLEKQDPIFGIPPFTKEGMNIMSRYVLPAGAAVFSSGMSALPRIAAQVAAGATGEQAAQEMEIASGDRTEREFGRTAAAGIMNTAPGGGAIRGAGQGLLAETARSAIDEGKMPSWKQAGLASLFGFGGGAANKLTGARVLSDADKLLVLRNESAKKMRKKGFKLNPNQLKKTGLLSWIAGDGPLDVSISRHNQAAAQKMAREAIGAKKGGHFRQPEYEPTGAVKRPGELDDLLYEAEAPYREVRKIAEDAKAGVGVENVPTEQVAIIASAEEALDNLKVVRRDATRAWQARNADPEAYARYEALKAQEKVLEKQIETAAQLSGVPGLLDVLKDARRRIAKIHVVKNATSPEDGLFNMQELPLMRERGVRLTGELQDLEEFAFHFAPSVKNPRQAAMDAPANLNMAVGFRQASQGNPAAGGGLLGPVAGGYAQDIIQSPIYQSTMVGPSRVFKPTILSQAAKLGIADQGRAGDSAAIAEIMKQLGIGQGEPSPSAP